jgi:DnaK suppressor protein
MASNLREETIVRNISTANEGRPATRSRKRVSEGQAPQGKKTRATNQTPVSSAASGHSGPLRGFQPYQPQPGEEYMSPGQLQHFREILTSWKQELAEEVSRTVRHLKDTPTHFPDPNDRASQESEFDLELRARDRERKLLKKIDSALARITDGSYGYCEETGEEIGLRRLEARPVATFCLEAQERREQAERQFPLRKEMYR